MWRCTKIDKFEVYQRDIKQGYVLTLSFYIFFEILTSSSGEIFHTLALLPRPLSAERKSVEMNGRHQSAPAPQKMQKQPTNVSLD